MGNTIKVDELNSAIMESLDDYNKKVVDGVKLNTKRAMKDLIDNTKLLLRWERERNIIEIILPLVPYPTPILDCRNCGM